MGKSIKECITEGCEKPSKARGWCGMHHQRWRLHGDPMYTNDRKQDLSNRFWSKVEKTEKCWNWTGATAYGYGKINIENVARTAHRLSWAWINGPIPDGMVIDHICHNHACVRPEHLRLATRKQNVEYRKGAQSNSSSGVRGVYPKRKKWSASVCHHGKSFYFGTYDTIAEAEEVVIRERARLFTFPEYGV